MRFVPLAAKCDKVLWLQPYLLTWRGQTRRPLSTRCNVIYRCQHDGLVDGNFGAGRRLAVIRTLSGSNGDTAAAAAADADADAVEAGAGITGNNGRLYGDKAACKRSHRARWRRRSPSISCRASSICSRASPIGTCGGTHRRIRVIGDRRERGRTRAEYRSPAVRGQHLRPKDHRTTTGGGWIRSSTYFSTQALPPHTHIPTPQTVDFF